MPPLLRAEYLGNHEWRCHERTDKMKHFVSLSSSAKMLRKALARNQELPTVAHSRCYLILILPLLTPSHGTWPAVANTAHKVTLSILQLDAQGAASRLTAKRKFAWSVWATPQCSAATVKVTYTYYSCRQSLDGKTHKVVSSALPDYITSLAGKKLWSCNPPLWGK